MDVMSMVATQLDSKDTVPYSVNSPLSLPPYESLAPIPLPENTPPFCLYPPSTPQPPPTTIPTPGGGYNPSPTIPILSPPPSPIVTVPSPTEYVPSPNPPESVPGPPSLVPSPPENVPSPLIYVPSPTEPVLSPPSYEPSPVLSPPSYEPSPPSSVPSPSSSVPSPAGFGPSPPSTVPSPFGFAPSPPVFQPPVVYPPPRGPPPPHTGPKITLWCVAKPAVPDPIIQEAMNYACGSGADCDSIQPSGSCFEPNTVLAHASYAFNSYWQRTKVAGGTCDFGGAAILVSVDPSEFLTTEL
ncbi:classical arabinogalactan protein 9-like [Cornus florida]|uniref:classical arabinogalactan protein 9-like n=1 Tax=Cornus florida TaxID=4283 RepID=UPI00289951F9|nr:classical arabinogalactan protein 9-like [Cornus florida]